VVRLAQTQGRQAPINAKLCELIHAAEQNPKRWTSGELIAALS